MRVNGTTCLKLCNYIVSTFFALDNSCRQNIHIYSQKRFLSILMRNYVSHSTMFAQKFFRKNTVENETKHELDVFICRYFLMNILLLN